MSLTYNSFTKKIEQSNEVLGMSNLDKVNLFKDLMQDLGIIDKILASSKKDLICKIIDEQIEKVLDEKIINN